MQQLALIGSSSSPHSDAWNASGASIGFMHSRISFEAASWRATANKERAAKYKVMQKSKVEVNAVRRVHHRRSLAVGERDIDVTVKKSDKKRRLSSRAFSLG